jgi:hypothetical protein
MDVLDAIRVGAQDYRYRYPAMSFLYTQHSLQDSKVVCDEELSNGFIKQNLIFEES